MRNRLSAGSALARRLQNVVAPHQRTAEFSSILLLLLHQILLAVYYCCHVATDPESLGVLTVLNSQPFSGVAAWRHSGLLRPRPRGGDPLLRRPVLIAKSSQSHRKAIAELSQPVDPMARHGRNTGAEVEPL